jgi:hypothetical protein
MYGTVSIKHILAPVWQLALQQRLPSLERSGQKHWLALRRGHSMAADVETTPPVISSSAPRSSVRSLSSAPLYDVSEDADSPSDAWCVLLFGRHPLWATRSAPSANHCSEHSRCARQADDNGCGERAAGRRGAHVASFPPSSPLRDSACRSCHRASAITRQRCRPGPRAAPRQRAPLDALTLADASCFPPSPLGSLPPRSSRSRRRWRTSTLIASPTQPTEEALTPAKLPLRSTRAP